MLPSHLDPWTKVTTNHLSIFVRVRFDVDAARPSGAVVRLPEQLREDGEALECLLDSTVLEGHRFAVKRVKAGEELLSWFVERDVLLMLRVLMLMR